MTCICNFLIESDPSANLDGGGCESSARNAVDGASVLILEDIGATGGRIDSIESVDLAPAVENTPNYIGRRRTGTDWWVLDAIISRSIYGILEKSSALGQYFWKKIQESGTHRIWILVSVWTAARRVASRVEVKKGDLNGVLSDHGPVEKSLGQSFTRTFQLLTK
ncbi:hypothetical protein B0H17DRAFT_1132014 [Mycena rosella]|uniref:Uncharacterized protein n=1 Tax=Mycena rosella TaxID=1033263 RepID=A0AAD7DMX2_MYCRO|nr:hypothetical protein B0H17DRAFT_1132014 [Mycena rosella]